MSKGLPAPSEEVRCPANWSNLSDPQRAALTALFTGKLIREAAATAGVYRGTLSRWLHHDPNFRAAYNAWRQELIDSTRARLLRTAELATATVHRAIAKGDGRLALALLDRLGLASPASASPGQVDPKSALDEIVAESEERRDALYRRMSDVCSMSRRVSPTHDMILQSLRHEAAQALPVERASLPKDEVVTE